ncbi:hypothetical protein [Streptomyces sp. NBC_01408]|uniref:hypothetical protein n=1 Tax=Streptomyces sp. NBC_01408 TaxID=2903855 RepID=UPI00224FC85A|nr:hypothetical protein [Streptomyces sp. NBC_01408]MCX4693038.1 hypothetical protein [Streptomyces sp. NBC_01408]
MNDSPGWATPGSSPSDGERPGAPADQSGAGTTQPPVPPAQPAGDQKWSAQQPPPGQWSSPGTEAPRPTGQNAPHAPQGQGWGSYGQQYGQQPGGEPGAPYAGQYGPSGQYGHPGGPGQWGKPPAAKPGVIPLRPLGLGEILDGAVSTLRAHWRPVLSISLVIAAVFQLALVLVQRATVDTAAFSPGERATPSEALDAMGDAMLFYVFNYYVEILGLFLVTALLAPVVSSAVLGHSSTLSSTLRALRPMWGRMLGLTLVLFVGSVTAGVLPMLPGILAGEAALIALGVPVGLVLLAWFYVVFLLAPPALMLERGSVSDALKRSAKLVKGSWWRVCGISLLTGLITKVTAAIIVMPFAITAMFLVPGGMQGFLDGSATQSWNFLVIGAIGSIIAAAVTMPMQTGVTTLLYIDQRIRREALDLELARAAGVENYGATTAQPASGPVTGG